MTVLLPNFAGNVEKGDESGGFNFMHSDFEKSCDIWATLGTPPNRKPCDQCYQPNNQEVGWQWVCPALPSHLPIDGMFSSPPALPGLQASLERMLWRTPSKAGSASEQGS
jgi:hypothetical protein